jgi:hypothetical protein
MRCQVQSGKSRHPPVTAPARRPRPAEIERPERWAGESRSGSGSSTIRYPSHGDSQSAQTFYRRVIDSSRLDRAMVAPWSRRGSVRRATPGAESLSVMVGDRTCGVDRDRRARRLIPNAV